MKTQRSGIGIVGIIILIAVLAGLGVGGYFAYTNYIGPMLNPYSKMVPESLKAYAKGANADAFIVFRMDPLLDAEIQKMPGTEAFRAYNLDGAIGLMNSEQHSVVLVMGFKTTEDATKMKDIFEALRPQSTLYPFNVKQEDKVVIVNHGPGLEGYTGMLIDNPGIQNVDLDHIDHQFIAYFDNNKMTEVNQALFSVVNTINMMQVYSETGGNLGTSLPSAHAQGLISPADAPGKLAEATGGQGSPHQMALTSLNFLISFIKNTTVYVGVLGDKMDVRVTVNIMQKDELANSTALQMAKEMAKKAKTDMTEEEMTKKMEEAYDMGIKGLSENFGELQKGMNETTKSLKNSAANLELRNNKTIIFTFNVPLKDLEDAIKENMEKAPKRSRDTSRKIEMNNLVVAIETYNADHDSYPQESACIDKIADFQTYFKDDTLPKDPQGKQVFGTIECENGYYYQSFGDEGYIVWAKMELTENGNAAQTPQDFADQAVASHTLPKFDDDSAAGGMYYVVNKSDLSESDSTSIPTQGTAETETTQQTQATQMKVKRLKSPATSGSGSTSVGASTTETAPVANPNE